MRFVRPFIGVAALLALTGSAFARPPPCEFDHQGEGVRQDAPVDEGNQSVSLFTRVAGDGFKVTDFIVLNCTSGAATELGAENGAGRKLESFVKSQRKAGLLTDIAGVQSAGRQKGFETKHLQGAKNSPVAICACQMFYPDTARPWARRAASYGVSAAY